MAWPRDRLGLSGVGLMVAEQLHRAGRRVVVVDEAPDPRWVRIMAQWAVPCLTGDPRRPETLARCGSAEAEAVICTVPSDLANLEIALLVREHSDVGDRVVVVGTREQLGDDRLRAGDIAYVVGPYDELLEVLDRQHSGPGE